MLFNVRNRRLSLSRAGRLVALFVIIWTAWDVIQVRRAYFYEATKEPAPFSDQKVFIASIHWTDELILRSHWVSAVLQLAIDIGTENVFVSVYESGSIDDAKGALRELDEMLERNAIPHRVVLDESSHKDEVEKVPEPTGWVQMPESKAYHENWTEWFTLTKGTWVPRRIPYLARLRNQAMQPLYELREAGQTFDKVLWLNDVVFNSYNVRKLLNTRSGDFAAACALDFKIPPAFYDTFALRDARGYAPIMDTWPFFRSAQSRDALTHAEPIPVSSCWNGMVAFDAAPFYDANPLVFRALPDSLAVSHLEASECCLIHADNPLTRSKGVWINPNVRVAYNGSSYDAMNAGTWPSSWSISKGLWLNRGLRWMRALGLWRKDHSKEAKLKAWRRQDPANTESGESCVIDEMQILVWNGWGHA
ncbi:glycosyltransferase family 69 protein [Baudoinia panamericana UAMH 10762]|uniref:Glycosyltransferase family 69 protein n=1 Tax=Baudoinia panamericana (strain UAMH 10762) TaxID=717646 RepID=M2N3K8_BAUPA|nr:glycosyltransferase family 69 protein [Baudoinia panamericana UAMH 10762]EMC98548.1 glycosyltransferase family 69 protein [Baudoinia panamericana UAMH 10762]